MFGSGQALSEGAGWQHTGDTLCSRVALLGPRHLLGQWPVALCMMTNWGLAPPQAWDVPPRAEPPLLQFPGSSSNAASHISQNFYF